MEYYDAVDNKTKTKNLVLKKFIYRESIRLIKFSNEIRFKL